MVPADLLRRRSLNPDSGGLLRWPNQGKAGRSPEEVVHAATLMGMGETLLQHILQEVCQGLHSLSEADAGFDSVPFAMNVSPRELGEPSLARCAAAHASARKHRA